MSEKISEINACVLKRPRHNYIVQELIKMNVNINYITEKFLENGIRVSNNNNEWKIEII